MPVGPQGVTTQKINIDVGCSKIFGRVRVTFYTDEHIDE
jgi:hypothetical protein